MGDSVIISWDIEGCEFDLVRISDQEIIAYCALFFDNGN